MLQVPVSPICDCCGLSLKPGAGEECPRCQYPVSLVKEERFLESALRDLQRVADHGGANLTIRGLIARYRTRLNYIHILQAGVFPQKVAAIQPPLPLETKEPGKVVAPPITPQAVQPSVLPVLPLERTPSGVPSPKPSPAPFTVLPGMAGEYIAVPPQAMQPGISPAGAPAPPQIQAPGKMPVIPAAGAATVATKEIPQQPARRGFSFSWQSFVVDQAITIIGLLGAFLILMGALSSVITTGGNPLLSFLIVCGVHAFFGIAGVIAYRFANFKLIARIYSGIYVLLVPLVGFTGYNLILGTHIPLSVPTLIAVAAVYAAIVYILLAIYQGFSLYGYLGAMALIVADLAVAAGLHLNYSWWPSMLMPLALPALTSIARSPTTRRERYFTGNLLVLRQPVRVFMYTIVGICLLSAVAVTIIALSMGSTSPFFNASITELRFSILSMSVLLLIWTAAWFWLTERTRELPVLAFLFLASALAFCYAFNFSQSGYVLTLVGVALLYHGLNRFAAPLLRPFGKLSLYLDLIALALVCLVPLISSYLLPQQLFYAAYRIPLDNNPNLYVHANWAGVAELIAVGVGCIITVSMSLLRSNYLGTSESRRNNYWPWLLLLSGFLLNWELSTAVLYFNLVPVWFFVGLTLVLIGAAVLVRERFGSDWANPIDVVILGEALLALSLCLNEGADRLSALLLGFAALFYAVVLYQRRQRWLFLPVVFAALALPVLLFSRPYVALLIGALLPFAAVAIRRIMAYTSWVVNEDTVAKSKRVTLWEWPPIAVGLLYAAVACLIDVLVSQYGGLSQSIVGNWLGVTFPVAMELATLALAWYVSAAMARVKWWLIPVIGFAVSAVLLPSNPFWILAAVTPAAAILGFGVSRIFDRTWVSPLYIVALLSAIMTGIAGYQNPAQLLAASWILLGFGLLSYAVGQLEGLEPCLWLLPVFTTWALVDAAQLGDLYRPPTIALIYTGFGVAIGLLNIVIVLFLGSAKKNNFLKFALPFYASAFAAAVLTGVYGMLPGAKPPFYGAIPDALLLYALAAFGVLLFERQPRWLWLVAGFATWATLLATQQSIYYVTVIGLGTGLLGMVMSRVIKQRAVHMPLSNFFTTTVSLSWGWPWYVASLVTAIVVGSWPVYNINLLGFAGYALLAFAVLAYITGIAEAFVPLLWVAPLLATWSLINSAISFDANRLLIVALVCTALGVATSSLRFIPRFAVSRRTFFNYALPIYTTALVAAVLTGIDGTLAATNHLFYLVIVMLFAVIAYAVALFERQPYWQFIVADFAVWATLLAINTTDYYVAGIAIAAGIAGIVIGRLIRRPAVDSSASLIVQWQQQFSWSWSWYITALVATVVTGLWPYLPMTAQPVAGFIEYSLLAFAVLYYVVGVIEDRIEVLWIGSLFATWSLVNSARGNDFPRLLIATLVYTVAGVVTRSLKSLSTISDVIQRRNTSDYALIFYATALVAAILSGGVITLFTLRNFLYGGIPDALPLLVYAGIAFAVLLLERQPRWLALVTGFGIWGTLLAPRSSIGWVIGIAIATALIGLLVGRLIKKPASQAGGLLSRYMLSTFVWSWPWYLTSLIAMIWTAAWQQVFGLESQSSLVAYSLLVYAVITLCIMLVERVPEALVLPVIFASLAILLWHPHLDITAAMIAFTILCVLIFLTQLVWKVITPLTRSVPASLLHNLAGIGGQFLVVLVIIGNGGLFVSSGMLAFVGAGSLFVLALMAFVYGRIQENSVVRRSCNYAASLLVSLVVSWTLAAFGQTNFDLLTLAPATYLIVIAPLLFRDEALPEHRLIGECIAVLGTALLLLPTLWLSFAESELNLVYTVVLLLESLVLLLLGIGVGVRVFILSGAGLIVVAALHALFLPSLEIPTPLALTILGLLLLAVSTGLSLARRRLRSAWSQWD